MKKIILIFAMIFGCISLNAQKYSPAKKQKMNIDDLSISVTEYEKNKIDWNFFKEYFSDKKENDSIQFSVKIIPQKEQDFTVTKKYSVKGINKNINELISTLKKMVE